MCFLGFNFNNLAKVVTLLRIIEHMKHKLHVTINNNDHTQHFGYILDQWTQVKKHSSKNVD